MATVLPKTGALAAASLACGNGRAGLAPAGPALPAAGAAQAAAPAAGVAAAVPAAEVAAAVPAAGVDVTGAGGPAPALFDRAALLDRVDGDERLMRELIAIFQREAEPLLQAVVDAAQVGNVEKVSRTVHRMAGLLLNLSAPRAAAVALKLERHARSNDLSQGPAMVAALTQEIRALEAHFQAGA